jgi:hypothetical protein
VPSPGFGFLAGAGWRYGSVIVSIVWGGAAWAPFPLCRWFAGLEARRREAWLS